MPKFTRSKDGIQRMTFLFRMRFTETEWERLKSAARRSRCTVRSFIEHPLNNAQMDLWDRVEMIERGEEDYDERD